MKQSNSWLSGLWRAADMASRSASPASADDERHGDALPDDFYTSKVQASQFMFEHILPRTRAHAKTMFTPVGAMMDMKEDHFSFDY